MTMSLIIPVWERCDPGPAVPVAMVIIFETPAIHG
jgi:hypothetical protein